MLEWEVRMLTWWSEAGRRLAERAATARHDDRGEVTATTAIIVLLVAAAIAAGAVIAAKIASNAENVPSP